MFKPALHRRAVVCPLVSLLFATPPSLAQEAPIEEIIVTGSFLKRDSFDSPSPLTVVTADSIEANATPNLGEVLVSQTFNYGTDFQTNTYAARFQLGNISQANLRGLGPGATLDLIDGLRTNNPFLSNAMPQIAIERIDVLKDSASALYGTDAVAGVVNIIPLKNYDGARASAFYTSDEGGDFDEKQFEFLLGSPFDRGHFTFAARYAERSTLEQTERPKFLREGFERSGTGNPGDWLVPVRGADGSFVDANPAVPGHQNRRRADPGCGAFDGPGGRDVGKKGNWQSGDPDPTGSNCRLHFGEMWNYMNPQDQYSAWVNYRYDFNDHMSNDLDITFSRLETDSRGTPQNPGGRIEEFPIVLGDHPGNPFRAFSDLNGNGVIDDGERLFAQDDDNDGIPDRGDVDANNDGVPDVVLAANPFDPASGIPFNEDVDVVELRAMGKLGTLPTALNDDGSNTGNATFTQTDFRIADTLTITIPDTSWELSLNAVWEEWEWVYNQKNTSQSALINGLNGTLKPDPTTPETTYWNPFSTQQLECVDRICAETGNPTFANTLAVMNAINITTNDVSNFSFYTFGAIATGDVLELPAGMLRAAVGADYRKNTSDVDLNSQQNQCDWHEGGCGFDYKASQDVYSGFFELGVPVLADGAAGNLELNIAGRYVDYGGAIGDDFTPKIAGLWQPTQWMSVRASWGEAFIAPSIEDLYEPEDCGLQTANDPVLGDDSNSFRVACVAGNPNLAPETADVYNFGISFSLLDGDLNFGVDYSVYDFEDRIAETALNNVLTQDFNNFVAAGFTPGNVADVLAWDADPRSDPAIIRDSTGVIARVITTRLNATTMKNKSYDFYARYDLDLDSVGTFGFNVEASLVDEYTYDLGPGLPSGDAAGSQNEQLIDIPPMPEWRVNATVNWLKNNHSAMVRVRWIDGFDLSFNSAALQAGQVFFNGTDKMDDIYYTDINYAYRFEGLTGSNSATTVEVGGRNIFDEFPDPIFNLGGLETFVHDIRGAMWYVRVKQDF